MPATTAFNVAATTRNGAYPNAINQPTFMSSANQGTRGKTKAVLITTPATSAGITPNDLCILFNKPIAAAAKAMPMAIGICSMPKGKPLVAAVAKCPNPLTRAPSAGPKSKATKKPGNESKARLPTGLGILISEPTTLRAENMANRAVRMAGEVLSIDAVLVTGFVGLGIVISPFYFSIENE